MLDDLVKAWLDLFHKPIFVEKLSHKCGNMVIIQNPIKITQEKSFQTIGFTQINIVEAFKSSEKIIIDTHKEAIIIYGLYLSLTSVAEAHKITGKSGKTQGAKIVSTQAKNDTISKVIMIFYKIKLLK